MMKIQRDEEKNPPCEGKGHIGKDSVCVCVSARASARGHGRGHGRGRRRVRASQNKLSFLQGTWDPNLGTSSLLWKD